jgi:hypothetical protein
MQGRIISPFERFLECASYVRRILLLICGQSSFRDAHQKRIADFERCVNGRNPRRPLYVANPVAAGRSRQIWTGIDDRRAATITAGFPASQARQCRTRGTRQGLPLTHDFIDPAPARRLDEPVAFDVGDLRLDRVQVPEATLVEDRRSSGTKPIKSCSAI